MRICSLLTGRIFQLHGRVVNVELVRQHGPYCRQKPIFRHGGAIADDMDGETDFAAGDSPDVQIMHAARAWNGQDGLFYFFQANSFGHTFEQNIQTLFQECPGAGQHP